MKIPVDKYGDLECGDQYYAVQWRRKENWHTQSRENTLPDAVWEITRYSGRSKDDVEWRIVYVTEMIRVVDYGNDNNM